MPVCMSEDGVPDLVEYSVDIQRRYSHVNNKPIGIDDFDLLKVSTHP